MIRLFAPRQCVECPIEHTEDQAYRSATSRSKSYVGDPMVLGRVAMDVE